MSKNFIIFGASQRLSASGSKLEITNRIHVYLQTGEIIKPVRSRSVKQRHSETSLSLETVILEGHRCSHNI